MKKRLITAITVLMMIIGLVGINTNSINAEDTTDYLCFTAVEDESSVQLTIGEGSPTVVSLEYKKNNGSWSTYDIDDVIDLNSNDKVYFRNISDTTTGFSLYPGMADNYYQFVMTGKIACSGDSTTLINKNGTLDLTPAGNYCFYELFRDCTSLVSISENLLPATTLVEGCYCGMFFECSGLTSIPENLLPATTLAKSCYSGMFSYCTGLTSIPENLLPATNLAEACYEDMFSDCTGLTLLPANLLPATTLAKRCYMDMFMGCTNLMFPITKLPATSLAEECCWYMFGSCTSLQIPPELPATILAPYCYGYMFDRCTSLQIPPELPATTLVNYCYADMFLRCTSLLSIPELPATILANYCYGGVIDEEGMFGLCSGILISDVQSNDHSIPLRIPSTGNITVRGTDDFKCMFRSAGGSSSFTIDGTPIINNGATTLYLKPTNVIITYNANGADNGTTPTDGPYTVLDTVTVKNNTGSLAKTGKMFKGWSLRPDGKGKVYNPDDTFTIKGNMTVYAVWEDGTDYQFTLGSGQTYTKGTLEDKLFTCDGPLANLASVKVDNVEITETTQYTKESGSTKITLLGSYLETLGLGSHTLKLTYSDGPTPAVTFDVVNPITPEPEPTPEPASNNNSFVIPNTGIE